ncbi:unnamed protein product [Haemonchus placei]|uniref:DUF86 domain-containing protein n=1 Tax=Haemonchus placei TaxID=6290 RepID=A0A0N4WDP5_HAEPC|nr:unnamed protein product [Haemonchus placei]
MSEVAERYVEQIHTTAETLRRRIIAYYDGIFFLGNKLITAADRARDIAEPVAYDVKDYVSVILHFAISLSLTIHFLLEQVK